MSIQAISLSDVVATSGTQIRARIDSDIVSQYSEDMREDAKAFPPVVVFRKGSQYILADGFHRVMAAGCCGFKTIKADVRKGTKSDALRYALGANAAHGLRRTNADKRRSVELALAEWPRLSDRKIAEVCAVSHQAVTNWRGELSTVDSSPPLPRIGRDGKERNLPQPREQVPSHEPDDPPPAAEPAEVAYLPPGNEPDIEPIRKKFMAWLGGFSEQDLGLVRLVVLEWLE
jgi:hypothetical protein